MNTKRFRQPDVGRRVRQLREGLGLSRERLAERSGTSPSAIYRLEHGDNIGLVPYLLIVEYFARERLPEGLIERIVMLPEDEIEKLVQFVRWRTPHVEDKRG